MKKLGPEKERPLSPSIKWGVVAIAVLGLVSVGAFYGYQSYKADLKAQQEAEKRNEELASQPGTSFRDCSDCPELVVIPAGSFQMGGFGGDPDELPGHRVSMSRPFAAGKYEVTFEEYDTCVTAGACGGSPDDIGWGRGDRPVLMVSWEDAQKYVTWLSNETGADYRLLSEAEWEYAASAGATTDYSWGDRISHENANFGEDDCCGGSVEGRDIWAGTAPVGSFAPNAFGLYDMNGNLWEWVEDCWNDGYYDAPVDGTAWTVGDCNLRVLRGGSFGSSAYHLRSAIRSSDWTTQMGTNIGFRIARTLD